MGRRIKVRPVRPPVVLVVKLIILVARLPDPNEVDLRPALGAQHREKKREQEYSPAPASRGDTSLSGKSQAYRASEGVHRLLLQPEIFLKTDKG